MRTLSRRCRTYNRICLYSFHSNTIVRCRNAETRLISWIFFFRAQMPTSYQPKQGGSIEIVSEKAVSDILLDLNKRPDSSDTIDREEDFINAYIQQNNKRIQVRFSSSLRTIVFVFF